MFASMVIDTPCVASVFSHGPDGISIYDEDQNLERHLEQQVLVLTNLRLLIVGSTVTRAPYINKCEVSSFTGTGIHT